MTTTPTSERVAADQVDREAAASLYQPRFHPGLRAETLAGERDDGEYVQAFARHRLAALSARRDPVAEEALQAQRDTIEAAARVADMYDHRGNIGRAIRCLRPNAALARTDTTS